MKTAHRTGFLLIAGALVVWGCDEGPPCEPGESQPCFCPDGSQSIQSCNRDADGWGACGCTAYRSWCDPDTRLCWQDPAAALGVPHEVAVAYCGRLTLDGADDWRLPDLDELRTLVRGCAETASDGSCPVGEGSARDETTADCARCITEPPPESGCYWPAALSGECSRFDDRTDTTLEFWASSIAADDPGWAGFVHFGNGGAGFNHRQSYGDARCVREAP